MSHSVQPSPAHGSKQFVVDTQDIVSGENLGYRPVLEVDHNALPNPYSREIGVSKITGKWEPKPENWETGDPIPVPV